MVVIGAVLALLVLGVVVVVGWSAVALVLVVSDLLYAAGRGVRWGLDGSYREGRRLGGVLRWSGVKWYWRQGVSGWARGWVAGAREALWWVRYPRERLRVGVGWCAFLVSCGVSAWVLAVIVNYVSGPAVVGGRHGEHEWPGWAALPEWGWWGVVGVVLFGLLGCGLWIRQGWVPRTVWLMEAEREAREAAGAAVTVALPVAASADRRASAGDRDALRLGPKRRA